ncbi:two-component system sensor histidine kinase SenX3 [Arcanobacterium wilhelmae]|uniref:Sensor-like histidine kinase SenX3 n=1 Tax=Arcanobacterium wilhelmae TaxID=1803177 RepID=A0ABT9NBM5_9ACTO|nr:ATP-binding protein [Arcanobacterium wilhelmae]MDP9801113.1 two-component system sensor histidine kinase SenX3 [Arcanobacterium wilhelmae]WFN90467.1 ATP-binding protein [Arcanobacterium wilhelmae]
MNHVTLLLVGLLIGVAIGGALVFYAVHAANSREIHERRRRAAAEKIGVEDVLRALPLGSVIVDRRGEALHASPDAASLGLLVGARLRGEFTEIVATARADADAPFAPEAQVVPVRGELGVRQLEVRAVPLDDGAVLVLFRDVTAEHQAEALRQDFVANVSHELKTPVGAIRLLAETIETNASDPETVAHFSGRLARETERLSELVSQIMELSRVTSGVAMERELVSVDQVVAEALDRARVGAVARGVELVGGGETGLTVRGSEQMLVSALRNLLDNAVRYSRENTRVSVGVSRRDGNVEIAVVDAGIGVPPEIRGRIFERFFRGDEARTRDAGGNGLGLAIVKHAAAEHGGEVRLWSEVGRGSTFTLVIPDAGARGDTQPTGVVGETGETQPIGVVGEEN